MHTTSHTTPRVLVIGSRGALGGLVSAAFRDASWDVVAGVHRRPTDSTETLVDLDRPDTVAAALEGVDVVINPVPDLSLTAERLVLERGGALVNLSAMPADAARRLRSEATSARGAVVMDAGVAPGLTNIVAADMLDLHPEADEVEMVFTVSTRSTSGPAAAAFAHRGLTTARRHETTVVALPEPFGLRRCIGFAEADAGWLGPVAGGRPVRTYICFAEPSVHRLMLRLNSGRLLSHLPRRALRPGPRRGGGVGTQEPVGHWVAVRRNGVRLAARTIQGHGDYRMAAQSAVTFADALVALDAEGSCRGVLRPEEVCSVSELAGPLQRAGIRVVDPSRPSHWADAT